MACGLPILRRTEASSGYARVICMVVAFSTALASVTAVMRPGCHRDSKENRGFFVCRGLGTSQRRRWARAGWRNGGDSGRGVGTMSPSTDSTVCAGGGGVRGGVRGGGEGAFRCTLGTFFSSSGASRDGGRRVNRTAGDVHAVREVATSGMAPP